MTNEEEEEKQEEEDDDKGDIWRFRGSWNLDRSLPNYDNEATLRHNPDRSLKRIRMRTVTLLVMQLHPLPITSRTHRLRRSQTQRSNRWHFKITVIHLTSRPSATVTTSTSPQSLALIIHNLWIIVTLHHQKCSPWRMRGEVSRRVVEVPSSAAVSLPIYQLESCSAVLLRRLSAEVRGSIDGEMTMPADEELSSILNRRQAINEALDEGKEVAPQFKNIRKNIFSEFHEFSRQEIKEYEKTFKRQVCFICH